MEAIFSIIRAAGVAVNKKIISLRGAL